MKKTLIALAVLTVSGAAFAQSTITIKGTFDPSFVSQKSTYGNGNSVTQTGLQNNRQGTSQITFLGTEDLGGGLKANFLYEGDFNATQQAGSGNAIGDGGGEVFVGLSGGFGSLKLGAPNTPSLTAQTASNPFGTKIGSGFSAMNAGHVRSSNSIRYDTPSFSGFTAAVLVANKTKADTNPSTPVAAVADSTDIGLFYANGPLAAGVSFWKTSGLAGAADNKETNAYVSYDLGVAKVGAGMFTEETGTTVDSSAYNLSVAAPMGAVTLMGNYARKNDKTAANKDRTVTALGAKYDLSKRTSIYARVVNDKIDNETTATTAYKNAYTLVGVQHNF